MVDLNSLLVTNQIVRLILLKKTCKLKTFIIEFKVNNRFLK
jgi:hypothetical protein